MVKLSEIAAELETELNENSLNSDTDGQKYKFEIAINTDKFIPSADFAGLNGRDIPIINCCLMQDAADITPLQGLGDFDCGMRMVVVCDVRYQQDIYDILMSFGHAVSGSVGSNNGYAYAVSASTPETGAVDDLPGFETYAITFIVYLRYLFISGGVLSDNVKMWMNGQPMPYLSMGSGRARTPNTANVLNNRDLQSYAENQGLTFTLEMPFKNDGMSTELSKDLLIGDIDTVYQIKYYDGVTVNTEHVDSAQQPSKVFYFYVIMTSAGNSMQLHKIAAQQFEFTLARADVYADKIAALKAVYAEDYDAPGGGA